MESKNVEKKAGTILRVVRYLKPYWYIIVFSLGMAEVSAYCNALAPVFTQQVIDHVIVSQHYDQLNFLLLILGASVVGSGVAIMLERYTHDWVGQHVMANIRQALMDSLQKKSFSFYDKNKVGQLVSSMTVDVEATGLLISRFMEDILSAMMGIVTAFIIMFGINSSMALLCMVPLPFIFFFTMRFASKDIPLMREQQEILGVIGTNIQQNIFGMKVLRCFQGEERAVESYKAIEEKYLKNGILSGKLQAENMPLGFFILTMVIAAVYVYGGSLILMPGSLLTIGQLYLFIINIANLVMPTRLLSMSVTQYTNAKAGAERIFAVMDEEPTVKNKPDVIVLPHVEGEVKFEHVYFEYLSGKTVLQDVNFTAKPGEIIAILGATGSGKSTLIYLVPRFYDVTKGRILIDGIDVRDVTLKSLRQQVGVVLQEVFLFTGTIRDNIAFGKPNATQEEVETAAKLAKAHDFIILFPQGYDTMIGERGIALSGGQKQRIAIARTLVTDPRILILDDSLSYVDAKTEQDIQQALKAVMKDRTSFIIAQRLSTIKNAHRIMILENGRIAEMGTHEELIAYNGIYKRIYETQFEALTEIPQIYGESSSKEVT
jgi:ABC-type multidrug transport system fused ATPase/permease subunit